MITKNSLKNVSDGKKAGGYVTKVNSYEEYPIAMSSSNRKWIRIRKQIYNETVWKGWRETDHKDYQVITYKTNEK